MIRFAILPLLCALWACQQGIPSMRAEPAPRSASTAEAAKDLSDADQAPDNLAFILPGDFSEQTSVADLETRFGKANVTIVDRPDDRGGRTRSVILFPGDPTRRAYVDFHDDGSLDGLAGISVRDAGSRWRGKHGVHMGMSFADLRRANGKPFGFTGFDSERRGWAHDQWSPALDEDVVQLGALDVDEGDHMYFGVELGLRGDVADVPADALPADETISSDDPRYPRLGELVVVTAFSATTSLDDEWQ